MKKYRVSESCFDAYLNGADTDAVNRIQKEGLTAREIKSIWADANGMFWDGEIGIYRTLEDVLANDFEEI